MSDTMTAGTVEAPAATIGGATSTEVEAPSSGAESTGSEIEENQPGGQTAPDGGSANGQAVRQRGKSVYSQVRELQSRLREQRSYWESEVGQLRAQIDEIKQGFAGRQQPKPGKTFWEAPEEVLEERLASHLSELEKRMQSKFEQTQEQREKAAIRQQELSEAAKFIRSQKGITDDDIQEIRDILESRPYLEGLPPMEQAEYALLKWQKEKGITDKSALKAKASTVTGAPPNTAGKRTWTEAEINAEMGKFPPNPANWTPEDKQRFDALDREIRMAYKEKRVTK